MVNSEFTAAIREEVRRRYAEAARAVSEAKGSVGCCGGDTASSCRGGGTERRITANLYDATEIAGLPDTAVLAALGCGNPTALVDLRPGEVVLDLGSGGGIDVLLSARRVGPKGFVYGLDMTDEMLALARANAAKAGLTNVAFLKGHIEEIPLPDASVDVVISNCVINLSVDKDAVLREAFRVLKPGGRFAVSDVVIRGRPLNVAARRSLALWAGCIGGALTEHAYRQKLAAAGFERVSVEVTREHPRDERIGECCIGEQRQALLSGRNLVSAFVRATKPSRPQIERG